MEVCKKSRIKMIDLKFCDLLGAWQHFTIPLEKLDKKIFTDGIGFDGSSIRGFKKIQDSDMILIPDIETFSMDPFSKISLGSFICDIFEPGEKTCFEKDPRFIAKKAEKYLAESKIADRAYFGPEAEFFIFDKVKFNQSQNFAYYEVKSSEANWEENGSEENSSMNGHKIRNKEGYFPVAPLDQLGDIRKEMVFELQRAGIEVEKEHHEVSTAGQAEIDIKYDSLRNMGDKLMMFKYVVKNVAVRHGKTATFMPKPILEDNGSGMHVHISLWKKKKPLFYGDNYAGLSKTALYFIGGLLKHSPAVIAFAAPTTNSYKRLVPGFEAPVNLAYSARNRSAAIRIPAYSDRPEEKRIEFRPPDPSANPYLAFSAMLLAGIDGIKNKIDPGKAIDKNIYELEEKQKNIPQVPPSLDKSLLALEKDYKFLLAGGVFSKSVIKTWIDCKRTAEYDFVRTRPNAAEFILYYNI